MTARMIRVLLVDDDEDDAVIVQSMLRERMRAHWHCEWVRDFDLAIRALSEQRHDVYLVDYYLGERRGSDFLREMKRLGTLAPVILLTGRDDPALDEEVATLGASEYLVKGRFDAAMLERTIRYTLMAKRSETDQRFLAEVGRRLARILNVDECLRLGAQLAVPRLADYALVFYEDAFGAETHCAGAHRDPSQEHLVKVLVHNPLPSGQGLSNIITRVHRTGVSERIEEISDSHLAELARTPAQLDALRELRPRTGLVVPLPGRDRITGAMVFHRASPGTSYSEAGQRLAEELAARVSMAVDNASLYRQARRAVAARDRVLAIVSHDLRNPANTVYMSTAFLLQALSMGANTNVIRQQLEVIQRSVEQMRRLIDDLFDVARIESGQLSVEPEPLDLACVIDEVCGAFEHQFREKQLVFTREIPDAMPFVLADRARIIQVLANVLGNAVKFAPDRASIGVQATINGGEIKVATWNSGSHVSVDDLPHLFDPFWQHDPRDQRGAGLGLAITKAIIEAHGGRVHAQSGDTGVTIEFTLPTTAVDDFSDREAVGQHE